MAIKKIKNGKWHSRLRYKDPFTGEWVEKQKTMSKKADLVEWEAAIINNNSKGLSEKNVTLKEYLDTWFSVYKVPHIQMSTQDKIQRSIDIIVEYFTNKKLLKDLDRLQYQKFLNDLGKKYAYGTCRSRHANYNDAFNEAVYLGYIYLNPAYKAKITGTEPIRDTQKNINNKEYELLLTTILTAEDSASKFATLTHLYSGVRFAECIGLKWENINEFKGTLEINDQYDYKHTKELKPTKNHEKREVDMPAAYFRLMRYYRQFQGGLIKNGKLINYQGYAFSNSRGNPISNNAINKFIKKQCAKNKIVPITTHGFRHTKANIMVFNDLDSIYVQEQLGHKDPTTTQKYYMAATVDIKEKNIDRMDKFYDALNKRID